MNSDAGIAQDAGAPQDAGDDAGSAQDAGNSLDAGAPQDAGIDGGGICAFGRLFVGDVAITTPQDWANFVQGNYACVSGELSIRAPSSVVDGGAQLRALLPPATALRSVGALTMNGSDLETAELASLTFVAGNMTISGNRLTSLNLPALTNVSGRADLQANLTDLEFPALETVAGGLSVGGSLESLELPLLKNGGVEVSSTLITALDLPELLAAPQGLVVAGNQRLSRLTAPKLATSGAMTIVDGLSTVGFPELIEVDGNVRIGAGSLTSLDCPLLTTVDGHLDLFGSRSLATLSLPELTTVTGWISVFDSRLSAFSVPKLTNSERIDLRTNHLMQTVDLPALVDAELVIGFNGALVALNVPSLTSSGLVNVYNESALTTVQFPALSTVFSLTVSDSPARVALPALSSAVVVRFLRCSAVSLPSLDNTSELEFAEAAATTFSAPLLTSVASLQVVRNSALSSIDLPSVVSAITLNVSLNPALANVDAPALRTVNSFRVFDNAVLRQCSVDAMLSQLMMVPSTLQMSGNTGTPNTCP